MTETYPLRWPDGWKRTPRPKRDRGHKFKIGGYNGNLPTFAGGRERLMEELRMLGAHGVVISSDVRLRQDGSVHAQGRPDRFDMENPGVAVYFVLNNRPTVMAQDAFDSPGCNIRSLTLAVEAMRALGRHGGGTMMSKAFDGFAALPPPEGSKPRRPWWEVLRYAADPTAPDREFLSAREVEARWRALSLKAHPDQGGSHEMMAELNVAKDDAIKELGAAGAADEDEED
jgi:hypothetical protein